MKTPRKKLRKCKFCNHKNRKCNLDPLKCNAKIKICHSCKKIGHLPKSINCSYDRKLKKDQAKKAKAKKKTEHEDKLTKRVIKQIRRRIKELEELEGMALKCPSIFGSYSSKQETFDISQKDNSIKNIQLQHLILKTATMCARKFEHMDREKDKSVFSAYCIRKAHKLLQTKSLPNKNETVRIEAELDLFEKYFSNEKIETRNLSQPYNDGSYPSPQFNEIASPPSVGLNGIKEEYQIPQFDVGNDCITDESIIP